MMFPQDQSVYLAELSPANAQFLEHVSQHPEFLEKDTFRSVIEKPYHSKVPNLYWPVFAGRPVFEELAVIASGLSALLKQIPDTVFRRDYAAMHRFYGLDRIGLPDDFTEKVLSDPNGFAYAFCRPDLLHTAQGFKCLEINGGSYIGGWDCDFTARDILAAPATAAFLAEHVPDYAVPAASQMAFAKTLEIGRGFLGPDETEVHVAVLLPRKGVDYRYLFYPDAYPASFAAASDMVGIPGRLSLVETDDVAVREDGLYVAGARLHAALEMQSNPLPPEIQEQFKAGRLAMFSGYSSVFLNHKFNLAVCSDPRYAQYFTAEERAFIERYMPWTRKLEPDVTHTFHGSEVPLADLLIHAQDRLVLKPALGAAGKGVTVGREKSKEAWAELVEIAYKKGNWVVQELCEGLPVPSQDGEHGHAGHFTIFAPHWFSGRFGGCLLRCLPQARGRVVNGQQGAKVGVLLKDGPWEMTC